MAAVVDAMADLLVEITTLRPHVALAAPGDPMWGWPIAFMRSGLDRLVSLNRVAPARAASILASIETAEQEPAARMCTPSVLEIVARKRRRDSLFVIVWLPIASIRIGRSAVSDCWNSDSGLLIPDS